MAAPVKSISVGSTWAVELDTFSKAPTLTAAQTLRCKEIFQEISAFLDPLVRTTNHPLLKNKQFYDYVENLEAFDDPVATLWSNSLLQGCCAVAYAPEINRTPLSNALDYFNSVSCLHESSVQKTLRSLADIDAKISDQFSADSTRPPELSTDEIARCRHIFKEIRTYLLGLNSIHKCPVFVKNSEFYGTVMPLAANGVTQDPVIEAKIDILYHFMHPDNAMRSKTSSPYKPKVKSVLTDMSSLENIARAQRALEEQLAKEAAKSASASGAPPATERTGLLANPPAQPSAQESDEGCCLLM